MPADDAAEQQYEALVRIEMQTLNHFINNLFANKCIVSKYCKLKIYDNSIFFELKTFILYYKIYNLAMQVYLHALLKCTFGEKVRMFYTETDSFYSRLFRGRPDQGNQRALSFLRRFRF